MEIVNWAMTTSKRKSVSIRTSQHSSSVHVMRITNQEKFQLSELLRKRGLSTKDFRAIGDGSTFDIIYKYESFAFLIEKVSAGKYKLAVQGVEDGEPQRLMLDGKGLSAHFDNWCIQVSAEINTPTGWENIETENYLNTETSELEEHFSKEEKAEVRQRILQLQEKVSELELPPPDIKTINKKLDDLSKKIDHLNKFDWKSLFTGTIASLIMSLSVPPESAGMLWEYVKNIFTKRIAP